jgi:hypothetical protein
VGFCTRSQEGDGLRIIFRDESPILLKLPEIKLPVKLLKYRYAGIIFWYDGHLLSPRISRILKIYLSKTMNIKPIFYCSFLLILFQLQLANAQQVLRGKISNYTSGPSQIESFDRFSAISQTWGEVNEEGDFSIILEDNFLEKAREMAEEAQKNSPKGFTVSFKTVSESFACPFEEVETKVGDIVVSGLPELTLMDEMGNPTNGILYAVSSSDIARWLFTYRDENVSSGYYLEFYYLEGPATVKEKCLLETYTGAGEEVFEESTSIDLELQAGWNIIRYGIDEVFTSSAGKVFPLKLSVTRLETLPGDLMWFAVKE